jgi:uncharacterized membrane protein
VEISDHPVLKNINLTAMPPVLGFNKVIPKPGCEVVATWENEGYPAIITGQFNKGRVLAYTSDPAPHWGCNFIFWNDYKKFWLNVCDWLNGEN